MVLTVISRLLNLDVTIQMKADRQYLHLILLIMLFEVVLTQKLLSPEWGGGGGIVVSQYNLPDLPLRFCGIFMIPLILLVSFL